MSKPRARGGEPGLRGAAGSSEEACRALPFVKLRKRQMSSRSALVSGPGCWIT